jgi:prepilin-type N-terminal cleavage/methylation domain-containing protein
MGRPLDTARRAAGCAQGRAQGLAGWVGGRARRGQAGFTLVEMLVVVAIMILVTGAIFALVDPSHGTMRAQPEVADMQQRMRVATDQISKDLIMAGAGTYSGAITGALSNFFAPVMPFRVGTLYPNEPLDRFHPDRITISYVPNTAAQTRVRDAMPQPSSEIKVHAQPGCPVGDELCGFREGMRVLIYDDTGAFDFFTVTQVQTAGLHLQHRPPINPDDFSKRYTPVENARIAQVETHTYFIDRATNQLMHYWGDNRAPEPLVDNAVDLQFQYFGDPNPPLAPRPMIGGTNCIFDAGGNSTMPTLPSDGSSLVELPEALLKSGPLCGMPPNQFDADLYRLRKVRVLVRIQTPLGELRGGDPFLFRNPGNSTGGRRFVPDYELTFEVAPRNMNLTR